MKRPSARGGNSGAMLVAALAFILVVLAIWFSSQYSRGSRYSGVPGMMDYGNGSVQGMMQYYWNSHGSSYASLNSSRLGELVSSESAAIASNNTLLFNGSDVRVVVMMGPMDDNQSMYSFVIDNMTNPTLEFRKGANVTFLIINIDTDAVHSLTLTGQQPPYAQYTMPMMMHSYGTSMMLAPESSGGFAGQSISFVAEQGMYYVCTVTGHAQKGMYGRIIVD
ncbi:MAG: hypothetical protein KGH69_03025 [Candidatus Micrarchaeota archaeon]|nr:hypothetical protein [Candidatus Micrarchaeota archaeon]